MPRHISPRAHALLLVQRGVLASWQADAVGLSRGHLRRAARGGGWQQLGQRTFLATALEPTDAQRRSAAPLECGPTGYLSGCAALIEDGWQGMHDGPLDVVLPRGGRRMRRRTPAWIRLHVTTEVPRVGGTPRRATTARAAIDASVWARTPRERMFILTSVVQQGLATVDQMRRALATRDRVPWSRQITEVLDDLELGVSSMNEATFLKQCRARGLPRPRLQVARTAAGRRRRVDAEFRTASGRIVMVEIDGVGHLDVAQWQADLGRQNELLSTTGALLLRVSGWQVRYEPDPFFDLLLDVLRS